MIELRRAVPEDLDCLFEAANSAFAGSTVSGKGPRWKRSREFLGDCLAEQECWCILLDGRTVGGLLLFPQPDCLWLEGAFVEAGHQGEGIGQQALGELLRRYPEATWRLKTPAADKRDCHFYEKLGFARTGTETGHGGQEFALYEKIRILSEKPLTERDFSYIIIKLSCFLRQQVFYNIKGFGPPAEED